MIILPVYKYLKYQCCFCSEANAHFLNKFGLFAGIYCWVNSGHWGMGYDE